MYLFLNNCFKNVVTISTERTVGYPAGVDGDLGSVITLPDVSVPKAGKGIPVKKTSTNVI